MPLTVTHSPVMVLSFGVIIQLEVPSRDTVSLEQKKYMRMCDYWIVEFIHLVLDLTKICVVVE